MGNQAVRVIFLDGQTAIMKRYDQTWNHSAKYSWNRITGISGS